MSFKKRPRSRSQELRDPRAMRALAHPLRLTLLHFVMREGTLTATRAAELTGEVPASCSFHLRQLAKYGFVESAGGGRGRERPWRAVEASRRWTTLHPDPDATAAAEELGAVLLERDLAELDRYLRERRSYPPEWQEAALMSEGLLYLTLEELTQLSEEIVAINERYAHRTADPAQRPAAARAVRALTFTFPLPPTASGN
jgi:DNA-binding transcriptional ArsR family regulator